MSEGSHNPQAEAEGQKAKAICETEVNAEAGTATMKFGDAGTVLIDFNDLTNSKVEALVVELALMGAVRAITNAYGVVRKEGPAAAFKAAADRYALILASGIPERSAGPGPVSALETAIEVVAELKGAPVEKVREIVMGYGERTVVRKQKQADGTYKDVNVTLSGDDQRNEFLAKVKSDPATAGAYAAKRAPKKAKAGLLDEFSGL